MARGQDTVALTDAGAQRVKQKCKVRTGHDARAGGCDDAVGHDALWTVLVQLGLSDLYSELATTHRLTLERLAAYDDATLCRGLSLPLATATDLVAAAKAAIAAAPRVAEAVRSPGSLSSSSSSGSSPPSAIAKRTHAAARAQPSGYILHTDATAVGGRAKVRRVP